MSHVIISTDGKIKRFEKILRSVSDKDARRLFARALNRGGDQARTRVKRSLVSQTGIKYGLVNKAVETIRAHPNKLEYSLEAEGNETNLNLFGARQRKKGVSAAPWKKRRVFKSSFIVNAYEKRVYVRLGNGDGQLKQLFGPNISREIVKGDAVKAWKQVDGFVRDRVEHELMGFFRRGK